MASLPPPPNLAALERLLVREIPLSVPMGVTLEAFDEQGLVVAMPLAPNRNPHGTAFAGSLNALCTVAGWAMSHVLIERLGVTASTVIRRSAIKYQRPVATAQILARCRSVPEAQARYFAEMLLEKGQAKLDHVVETLDSEDDNPAVSFTGSYVVKVHGELP